MEILEESVLIRAEVCVLIFNPVSLNINNYHLSHGSNPSSFPVADGFTKYNTWLPFLEGAVFG